VRRVSLEESHVVMQLVLVMPACESEGMARPLRLLHLGYSATRAETCMIITNSTKQSPSSEDDSHSPGLQITQLIMEPEG
jgi:hypothetical protein